MSICIVGQLESITADDRLRRVLYKSLVDLRELAKQETRTGAGYDFTHIRTILAQ